MNIRIFMPSKVSLCIDMTRNETDGLRIIANFVP